MRSSFRVSPRVSLLSARMTCTRSNCNEDLSTAVEVPSTSIAFDVLVAVAVVVVVVEVEADVDEDDEEGIESGIMSGPCSPIRPIDSQAAAVRMEEARKIGEGVN